MDERENEKRGIMREKEREKVNERMKERGWERERENGKRENWWGLGKGRERKLMKKNGIENVMREIGRKNRMRDLIRENEKEWWKLMRERMR